MSDPPIIVSVIAIEEDADMGGGWGSATRKMWVSPSPRFLRTAGDPLRAFPTFSGFGMFSEYDRENLPSCNVL